MSYFNANIPIGGGVLGASGIGYFHGGDGVLGTRDDGIRGGHLANGAR